MHPHFSYQENGTLYNIPTGSLCCDDYRTNLNVVKFETLRLDKGYLGK